MSIHGIRVLGTRHEIPEILKAIAVDEVLIAIPSVRSEDIRAVMEIIRNAGGPAKVKILPGILDLVDGNVTLSDIKEVRVEDLLGREKVEIDYAAIREFCEQEAGADHRGRRLDRQRAGPDGAPVRASFDGPP